LTDVLIADDDQLTSSLLQTLFELEGMEATCVIEAGEVVSAVEEQRPSLVLLDFFWGRRGSAPLIRQIRSSPGIASTPILVFSGEDKTREALAAGADRFLTKPFDPTMLVEIVKEMAG
jgi:DNA-binding response OmpR family regulator